MAGARSFYDRSSWRSLRSRGQAPHPSEVRRLGKPVNEPLRPRAPLDGASQLQQRRDSDHLALLRQEGIPKALLMFLGKRERAARIGGEFLLRARDQAQ